MRIYSNKNIKTSEDILHSVKGFAAILEIPKSTIYGWIKKGEIISVKRNGIIKIPMGKANDHFVIDFLKRRMDKPSQPYVPEQLKDFNEWHKIIDYFSWLFKVCYTPRKDIKKKKFRIDIIFQNYLAHNNIELSKVQKVFSNKISSEQYIIDDLKRGWYNELAFIFPLKESTLGLSYKDIELNNEISPLRFAFPSWKITTLYYSMYFYLRSINFLKIPTFRKEEHKATINIFKNNVLKPLNKVIWKFPLNISYHPNKRIYRKNLLINRVYHTKYEYCDHPRPPYLTPNGIFEEIYGLFKKRGKSYSKPSIYTIFDYLLEFRIWANYLDIDNLISLRGIGYKSFLDQNLSLILFMIGGISELCFISTLGETNYLKQLQILYDLFASNNEKIKNSFAITSLYQRLKIYNKVGIVKEDLELKVESDINEII